MKPIISIILSVIILHGSIVAQESSQQRRSTLLQMGLEVGMVGGDFFAAVSDSPFQFGGRIGLYRFISKRVSIGGSLRAAFIPLGKTGGRSRNGGGGPDIIIMGKVRPEKYGFFAGFHAHYTRQKVNQRGSVGGIEIGARIGGMRLTGGAIYGIGFAVDIIDDAPNGIIIYFTFGGATSSAKSDS